MKSGVKSHDFSQGQHLLQEHADVQRNPKKMPRLDALGQGHPSHHGCPWSNPVYWGSAPHSGWSYWYQQYGALTEQ